MAASMCVKMLRSVIPLNRIVRHGFLILPVRLKHVKPPTVIPPLMVTGKEQTGNIKGIHSKSSTRFEHDKASLVVFNHIQQTLTSGLFDRKLIGRVTVTKVVMAQDFTELHVYWLPTSVEEEDIIADVNSVLQSISHKVREHLQECRIFGKIPPVIFKQDKNHGNMKNTKKHGDALPNDALPEHSGVDYVVNENPLEKKTDFKSFEDLKKKFMAETLINEDIISVMPEKNFSTSYDDKDDKFSGLRSRYRQDICKVQHSFLMNKIWRKLHPKRNKNRIIINEELDHESVFKNIKSVKRLSELKKNFQLNAFPSPFILPIEDKKRQPKARSNNVAEQRRSTKKSKKRQNRIATLEDL